jgi:hypothetical protein
MNWKEFGRSDGLVEVGSQPLSGGIKENHCKAQLGWMMYQPIQIELPPNTNLQGYL